MLGFDALASFPLAGLPDDGVAVGPNPGSGISAGYFSRGRWHKLKREIDDRAEAERNRLQAIEARKRRKIEARAREEELRRQEAEWLAAAALEAQRQAEAIAKIAAQSQIIGQAGQQMRQSAMFAQMAAKAHEHAMRQRQAQQDDDDMMMLLLMDDE
jgi:predicted ribosome quality control (RQC) complex YloA/Tae2 family protein